MSAGNLIHIRRRVRSVSNMQQITRAMKFVSASRLRRAQERIFSARPYAQRMLAVLNSLVTRVPSDEHPLLVSREGTRSLLIVITGDKGLCGSFNSNVIKTAAAHLESEPDREFQLTLLGRKGVEWFRSRPWSIQHQYVNIMSKVDYKYAKEVAATVIDYFTGNELDSVHLVYNEFKSVIQQENVVEQLLPIQRLENLESDAVQLDYLYEQPPGTIFENLLPKHIETQIFRAMLESEAAEHGARMTAMDAATRNAKEVIEHLTRIRNRVRQASITTEIIEIVSGANALSE